MKRLTHFSIYLLLLLFTSPALAQGGLGNSPDPKALKDKVVTLRTFYGGDQLRYNADGTLQQPQPLCPWTVCSKVLIRKVNVKDDRVILRGDRLGVLFEGNPLMTRYPRTGEDLQIEIIFPGKFTPEELTRALSNVFLPAAIPLSQLVPDYWRGVLERIERKGTLTVKDPSAEELDPQIARVGNGVTPPRAKKAPDPEYSDLARHLKISGTLVLWAVVGENGRIQEVRVARPLGLGLDEQALKVLQNWEFEPALKEGRPVRVQANIEFTFRFY